MCQLRLPTIVAAAAHCGTALSTTLQSSTAAEELIIRVAVARLLAVVGSTANGRRHKVGAKGTWQHRCLTLHRSLGRAYAFAVVAS